MRPRITIHAISTSPWTGYGQIAVHLGRQLHRNGCDVSFYRIVDDIESKGSDPFVLDRLVPEPGSGWSIHYDMPNSTWMPPNPSRSLRFAMWETTRFPRELIQRAGRYRGFITPCTFNADCLSAMGVGGPIRVLPMGIDPREGFVPPDAERNDGILTFGTAGRLEHGGVRKGIEDVCRAFVAAFPGNERARLLIKILPNDPIGAIPEDPRIEVERSILSPPQMAAWFHRIDAYITMSKGEGWGLQTHQALACGRPVIAPFWSGTRDFIDETCGWPLGFELISTRTSGFPPYADAGGMYIQPSHEDAVEAMRLLYADPSLIESKRHAAAERGRVLSWEATGLRLMHILRLSGFPI